MKYTTHLSPSECRKRLANPTGNPTPEIKKIVNQKYIKYFDGSPYVKRFGTKVHRYDFELFCTFPMKYGYPDKPQVRLCGEILENEDGGSIIKCHFKFNGYLVFFTIIMPVFAILVFLLGFVVPNPKLTDKIITFACASFIAILIFIPLSNWKILLDFFKDLLEIRQSSVTEKTLQP
jgi:hypothetical protein